MSLGLVTSRAVGLHVFAEEHRLLDFLARLAGDRDAAAFCGERLGNRPADAADAAGDKHGCARPLIRIPRRSGLRC